jgi:tellurite resistance protein
VTETEIIQRVEALPERFASRLTEDALWSVRRMRGGGEYGELAIELAAALAKAGAAVTPEERDELRELLEAMNMPTEPIDRLNVQPAAGR